MTLDGRDWDEEESEAVDKAGPNRPRMAVVEETVALRGVVRM